VSERSHLDFLEDILNSIESINDYVSGMTYEEFKDDRRTVDAVVRNFEVIGEAASNIPDEVKERHQSVEWRGVVNFRNVMIHDYFRVDTGRVWDTMEKNLPELKRQVRAILRKETGENRT
jgi:uncharacterized protein with HEPN domain